MIQTSDKFIETHKQMKLNQRKWNEKTHEKKKIKKGRERRSSTTKIIGNEYETGTQRFRSYKDLFKKGRVLGDRHHKYKVTGFKKPKETF